MTRRTSHHAGAPAAPSDSTPAAKAPPGGSPPVAHLPQAVGFVQLGCWKSLVDVERMLGLTAMAGHLICGDLAQAETIVVNTCSFIDHAVEESVATLKEMLALKACGKVKRVVLTGCLAERLTPEIRAELLGLDGILGVNDREALPAFLEALAADAPTADAPSESRPSGSGPEGGRAARPPGARDARPPSGREAAPAQPREQTSAAWAAESWSDRARVRLTPESYAYLRVSEGCDRGCTFCVIPEIRGPHRSKPVAEVLNEARELIADGARELNLIGQDTTAWGTDLGQPSRLADLLGELAGLKGVGWLRLFYAYPNLVDDALIEALATLGPVVPYLDLPLQHVTDPMLRRMGRGMTRAELDRTLDRLFARLPDLALRTTFIVGFPGETAADFEALCEFVRAAPIARFGCFRYSPERGSPAAAFSEQVPVAERERRYATLMELGMARLAERQRARVGERLRVLVDRVDDAGTSFVARTSADAPDIDCVVYGTTAGASQSQREAQRAATARQRGARQEAQRAATAKERTLASPAVAVGDFVTVEITGLADTGIDLTAKRVGEAEYTICYRTHDPAPGYPLDRSSTP